MSERTIAQQLAATPEDHPDFHKLRAASARERAEHNCTFPPDSVLRMHFVAGYLEARLEQVFRNEAKLERELAELKEDRDGWKDLADARKPNRTLQTT